MAVRTTQIEKNQIYFCTITCYNWLPLFEITNYYNEIFKWFDLLTVDETKIVGYVIMPNHLHFMIFISESSKNLNHIISNGKRFMAYGIIKKLKENRNVEILNTLHNSVIDREKSKGKRHNVFMPSFDSKICYNEKFLLQKLDYIHYNPVKGKWKLVDDFIKYKYSSACFYELNKKGLYPVTHFNEVL